METPKGSPNLVYLFKICLVTILLSQHVRCVSNSGAEESADEPIREFNCSEKSEENVESNDILSMVDSAQKDQAIVCFLESKSPEILNTTIGNNEEELMMLRKKISDMQQWIDKLNMTNKNLKKYETLFLDMESKIDVHLKEIHKLKSDLIYTHLSAKNVSSALSHTNAHFPPTDVAETLKKVYGERYGDEAVVSNMFEYLNQLPECNQTIVGLQHLTVAIKARGQKVTGNNKKMANAMKSRCSTVNDPPDVECSTKSSSEDRIKELATEIGNGNFNSSRDYLEEIDEPKEGMRLITAALATKLNGMRSAEEETKKFLKNVAKFLLSEPYGCNEQFQGIDELMKQQIDKEFLIYDAFLKETGYSVVWTEHGHNTYIC